MLPIYILCLCHLILAVPIQPEYNLDDVELMRKHFNNFKVTFNRTYEAEEEELRFSYFMATLAEINESNKNNPLTVFDINQFSDLSREEFLNLLNYKVGDLTDTGRCTSGTAPAVSGSAPESLDWRQKNAVTPIQNQNMPNTCGSCWVFGSTAAVEGAFALKHGQLLKLSEQQLMDCDKRSKGCGGGVPHNAFTSVMELGGQELESDYGPYEAVQKECRFDKSKAKVQVSGCAVYSNINEDQVKELVAHGPLAIALDGSVISDYHRGIYRDKCDSRNLNHVVLIVGYGSEGGMPYWIIKNSWGSLWGEQGFMRVQRGNNCLGIGQHLFTVDVA